MINRLKRMLLIRSSTAGLQIDSLDGLRGVAVLFVLLSHLSNAKLHVVPWLSFSGIGKYGVYLFFILSSFLLTLQLLEKDNGLLTMRIWKRYILRRLLRIFPLYVFVLGMSFTFSKTGFVIPVSRYELLRHVALLDGKSVFWSIPVEFKYYFILPFVVLSIVFLLKRRAIGVMVAAIIFIVVSSILFWPADESTENTVSLGPYLPIFIIGSCSAFFHLKIREWKSFGTMGVRLVFEIAACIVMVFIVALIPSVWGLINRTIVPPTYFSKQFVLFGVLWSLFIVSYLNGAGFVERVLSISLLRICGVVSFSVYLWHIPVISFVVKYIQGAVAMKAVIVLFMTLLLSIVSYLVIERPFLKQTLIKQCNQFA